MKSNNYTILINSSDGFEDCWNPFFTLLNKYWKNVNNHQILLNTENKDYSFGDFNIKCTKANQGTPNRKLTWSECLIEAINQIETPLILYFQEDYFIEKPIKSDLIDEFAELMINDKSVKYLGLTHFGNRPPFIKWASDYRLKEVSRKSGYRISTQVALWRKETLLSYVQPEESGWMFEIFGTLRANKRKELFLAIDPELYNPKEGCIVEYLHTGIIKGKWHPQIPIIFEKNDIAYIDYNKRGFYKFKSVLMRKFETSKSIFQNPLLLMRYLFLKK